MATAIIDNIVEILFITGYLLPASISLIYTTYNGIKERNYKYLFRNTIVSLMPMVNIMALINTLEEI